MIVLAMGIVDLLAAFLLYNTGDIGFYLALALLFKGGMSVMGSSLLRSVVR